MTVSFFDPGVFQFELLQLRALFPYLALCMGMIFTTIASAKRLPFIAHKIILFISIGTFAGAMALGLETPVAELFGGSLVVDDMLRWISLGVATLALLATISVYDLDHSEWSTLLLVSVAGMTMLPGARDWVAFFIFLETVAIPGYVMAAFRQNRDGGYEAGLKYLLLGAFASAVLLMGMALLYGATGSFDYSVIGEIISNGLSSPLIVAATAMIILSAAFKVAMAPMHMWAADIYQSAPSSLASFMAGAGKLSVFGAILLAWQKCGFFTLDKIPEFIVVLSILSIVGGNFMALTQKSLRRMLAYSSVASAGYVAMLLPLGESSFPSMFVYLITYGIALAVAFAVIESLSAKAGKSSSTNFTVADLALVPAGSAKTETFLLTIAIFSMAGIPPFPGFLGKYLLISELWNSSPLLVFWIILGSMMGLAYYLRILVPLYFEGSQSKKGAAPSRKVPCSIVYAAGIGTIALFSWLWVYSEFMVEVEASATAVASLIQ